MDQYIYETNSLWYERDGDYYIPCLKLLETNIGIWGERYLKGDKIMGLFGDLFDFNNDGKLDSFEKAAELGAFINMVDSCQKDDLTLSGLDIDELDLMDSSERRKALEDAGLRYFKIFKCMV